MTSFVVANENNDGLLVKTDCMYQCFQIPERNCRCFSFLYILYAVKKLVSRDYEDMQYLNKYSKP